MFQKDKTKYGIRVLSSQFMKKLGSCFGVFVIRKVEKEDKEVENTVSAGAVAVFSFVFGKQCYNRNACD